MLKDCLCFFFLDMRKTLDFSMVLSSTELPFTQTLPSFSPCCVKLVKFKNHISFHFACHGYAKQNRGFCLNSFLINDLLLLFFRERFEKKKETKYSTLLVLSASSIIELWDSSWYQSHTFPSTFVVDVACSHNCLCHYYNLSLYWLMASIIL